MVADIFTNMSIHTPFCKVPAFYYFKLITLVNILITWKSMEEKHEQNGI